MLVRESIGRPAIVTLALLLAPTAATAEVAFSSLGTGITFSGNSRRMAGLHSSAGSVTIGNRYVCRNAAALQCPYRTRLHLPHAQCCNANRVGEIGTLIESSHDSDEWHLL